MRLGVDIGGTFTDAVLLDEKTKALVLSKVPSTPHDFSRGVVNSTQHLLTDLSDVELFIHGTTVGLNALLQNRVCVMGMLTTAGFRDIIEIGRSNRVNPYDLFYRIPDPLVPRHLRLEVRERIDGEGNVIDPLDEDGAREAIQALLNQEVDGIVVAFINSYKNPMHELRVQQLVREIAGSKMFCNISSAISQEYREYERFNTALINMSITPTMRTYLEQLSQRTAEAGLKRELLIMQSNGGTMSSRIAAQRPVFTLQSTLAGGMVGLECVSHALNLSHLVSADMGGTSFDIGCIVNQKAEVVSSYKVHTPSSYADGYRVLAPQLDVQSIGAGGGSIAWVDRGGSLHVGPQSAGADPGPACYSLGGEEPTVTDANLVLGRLNPEGLLGGRMKIDPELSHRAVNKIAGRFGFSTVQAAAGIIEIVNNNMAGAMKTYLLKRGHDPRDFVLVGYGGAGPLHGAAIAHELSIPTILVVNSPGNFSAWGMLMSDFKHDFARTMIVPLDNAILQLLNQSFGEMEEEGRVLLCDEGVAEADIRFMRGIDLRYLGQLHSFTVPVAAGALTDEFCSQAAADFDRLHQAMYLHCAPEERKEIVSLRVTTIGIISKPELALVRESTTDVAEASIATRQVYFGEVQDFVSCLIYARDRLLASHRITGPALVEELTSTTIVPPGWTAKVDRYGHLIINAES